MFSKIQQLLETITCNEKELEAFVMLGLIFTLFFLALLGVATGQSLAMIF